MHIFHLDWSRPSCEEVEPEEGGSNLSRILTRNLNPDWDRFESGLDLIVLNRIRRAVAIGSHELEWEKRVNRRKHPYTIKGVAPYPSKL